VSAPGVPPPSETTPEPVGPTEPGAVSLRAAVAEGRLRLGDLAPAVRWPGLAALGLVVVAALAILAEAFAIPLPGGTLQLPGRLVAEPAPVPVPNLAITGFLLGLAPASVALVASALVVPRRSTRAVILAVAGVNLSVGASALANLPLATAVGDVDPIAPPAIAIGCGGAIAASFVVALGGLLPPQDGLTRPASRLVTVLAAVPGMLLAATYLVGLLGSAPMPTPRPAGMEAFPDVLHIGAAGVAAPLYGALSRILPLVLAPIVLWEAATWARASRAELAAPIVRRVDRVPWLLLALVAAKLGWLALGYLGRLPASLGGAAGAWATSAGRTPVAWLIAAAFALAAMAWLARRTSPPISERGIRPGMRFVVGGFTAGSVVGGVFVVAAGILLLLPVTGPFELAIRLGGLAGDLIQPLQVATVPVALVAGLVLLRRGHVATGGFLAVAGAWMAPRALFVGAVMVGIVPSDAVNPLAVDLVTIDALITIAVAILALVLVAGRRTGADAGSLALVLVVSTLMAHGGTLVPAAFASVLVLTAVLFPAFRELVFGSRELNEPTPVRPARVLGSLGRLSAALLLVAGTRTIVAGGSDPGIERLGQLLFGPPYAALLVAAVVTMRRRRPGAIEIAEGTVVAPAPVGGPTTASGPAVAAGPVPVAGPGRALLLRGPAHGIAVGVGGLVVAVALAGLVVDPLVGRAWEQPPVVSPSPRPSVLPSPVPSASSSAPSAPSPASAEDLALFRALVSGVNERMTALQAIVTERMVGASGAGLAAAGLDLADTAEDGLAWLAAQPERPCFAPYRAAVARHLTANRAVGAAIVAVSSGGGAGADINREVEEVGASLEVVVASLESASIACGAVAASPSP
jgi:hypothetical protein